MKEYTPLQNLSRQMTDPKQVFILDHCPIDVEECHNAFRLTFPPTKGNDVYFKRRYLRALVENCLVVEEEGILKTTPIYDLAKGLNDKLLKALEG